MSTRYRKSEELLQMALEVIPLGTQTFSKSKTQYPHGVSPFYIAKGKGCYVWDADGNEYIDFVNGLGAITLGYCYPEVDIEVKEQLEKGTIFSLPNEIEIEVAKKIVEMIPCAEMVRFGKNGSDATAGAIRLARAYTGRDFIAVCGYHGWQDWYIGSTSMGIGVPEDVRRLTLKFEYNNLDSLRKLFNDHPSEIAGVILEPVAAENPDNGFLEDVKEVTSRNGAVLIFDEIVTGFRYSNGGAQEYFNVIPDLTTIGKGMANGFPISAIVGKMEIMQFFENVFFSFTYGGEALSLAACRATLRILQKEPVISGIWERGSKLIEGLSELIAKYKIENIFSIGGNPCLSSLKIKDTEQYTQWEIKTLLLQEMFSRGVIWIGSHNLSYSHSANDINRLLEVYDEIFNIFVEGFEKREISKLLKCNPLEPLFRIR